MKFVGGQAQGEFVEQVRGCDPERCLVVPIDVGKHQAEVLVADLYGQVVAGPWTFRLDRPGVAGMLSRVDAARADREAEFCRMGVESCGHYHRLLVWQLDEDGRQVVELNPGHVKDARSQQGRGRVKTDQTDLAAMASLLIQGGGLPPRRRTDALAVQRIWVAHRDRQVKARTALSNQVQGLVDQAFPSLADCWRTVMGSRSARVIIANLCDPDRVRGLGGKRLRNYVANRGVAMTRAKADQVVAAAKVSLQLPQADKTALQTPPPPTAPPGWPRLSTPQPAPLPRANPSAAKAAGSCAPRSSSSARAWPASTTTSLTTRHRWSHATSHARSSTSPSAAGHTGWRLR